MQIEIIRLDDNGRGIGYINGKIIFIPKTLPGDIVTADILVDKKKYSEGKVIKYINNNTDKIDSDCPYFNECGGCSYLNVNYERSLELKINNLKNNLLRAGFEQSVVVNKNDIVHGYRNKISLKINDGKMGFYEKGTNTLVEINECLLTNNIINKYINEIKKIKINNGNVVIRSNYKNEVIIAFETKDSINIDLLNKEDIIGLIHNDVLLYGEKHFVDKLLNLNFEVSYNSFFQVNPYVTEKIVSLLKQNISKEEIVLDLYSGVGTLSLSIASKCKKVYGIEIVKEAVINARNNMIINNIENAEFIHGDLSKTINIKDNIDTIIVDPPRSGLDQVVLDKILKLLPKKVIYISCNPNTLIRDLKLLTNKYDFDYVTAFDMFSYTHHLETLVILNIKSK